MLAKDLKIGEYGKIIQSFKGAYNNHLILRTNNSFYNFELNASWTNIEYLGFEIEKLENVKITYDGCKSEYPKMMIVAHHSDFRYPFNDKLVIGCFQGLYIVKDTHAEGYNEYSVWNFAKEIVTEQELVHLTLEDISNGKGVGVNPELLRIKK